MRLKVVVTMLCRVSSVTFFSAAEESKTSARVKSAEPLWFEYSQLPISAWMLFYRGLKYITELIKTDSHLLVCFSAWYCKL